MLYELVVIWVNTRVEVCKERMIKRNSDRDTWKLEHWDEYIASCNFNQPNNIKELIVFENSSEEEYNTIKNKGKIEKNNRL